MIRNAGFLCKREISFDLRIFAFGRDPPVPVRFRIGAGMDISPEKQTFVLTMRRDDLTELFRPFHGKDHRFFPLHPFSVVRKGAHVRSEGFHIGKILSFFSFRDRPVRQNFDRRVFPDDRKLLFEMIFRIRNGI